VTSSLAWAIAHRRGDATVEPLCGLGSYNYTLNRDGKSPGAFAILSAWFSTDQINEWGSVSPSVRTPAMSAAVKVGGATSAMLDAGKRSLSIGFIHNARD
jgi:hypothetical protein